MTITVVNVDGPTITFTTFTKTPTEAVEHALSTYKALTELEPDCYYLEIKTKSKTTLLQKLLNCN